MINYIDRSHDKKFEKIEGLHWYPWVGKKYLDSNERVLIIGESHYILGNGEEYQKKYDYCKNTPTFTRECIYESMICGDWTTNTYDNLHRVLFRTNQIDKPVVWQHLSYYNFIPRTMDYRIRERPVYADFYNAWREFVKIIEILKPTSCVFIGVEAANSFNYAMEELQLKHVLVSWGEKIGNTYSRKASLQINEMCLPIAFIQHTSQFFSWEKWNDFLVKSMPKSIAFLTSLEPKYQTNKKELFPITKESEKDTLVQQIPTWLSHKPILACDYIHYTKVSDNAKFLSLGRAQYNADNLSIKLFRKTNGRWSRQSEEIPIERVPDFTIMLIAFIKAMNQGTEKNTILEEEFIAKEDLKFASTAFQENKNRIVQGLAEIKNLLNDINLENL